MMIDFALDAERKEGKAAIEAIYEACLLRFRPIMMTTMAALLGALPLAVSTGVGGGTSPATGHCDRWRIDRQSDIDALYDAGGVPGVRSPRQAPRGAPVCSDPAQTSLGSSPG